MPVKMALALPKVGKMPCHRVVFSFRLHDCPAKVILLVLKVQNLILRRKQHIAALLHILKTLVH